MNPRVEVHIGRLRFEGLTVAEAARARQSFESTMTELVRGGPTDAGQSKRPSVDGQRRIRLDAGAPPPAQNIGRHAAQTLYRQVVAPELAGLADRPTEPREVGP